ncbi:MAG TPA: MMPL family transporter [Candidatus Dormibacteraeota bacterium]|jgi:RND superfamily putative drug exporter|nr:MMPL family transporter [Candidatus Dormibacteraeota bacterium]
MFDRWGRFVYRRRWAVLVVSAVMLGLSIAGILAGGTLAGNGGFGANLAAGQTQKLITAEIQPDQAPTGSNMDLIVVSKTLSATDPAFQSAVEQSIAGLKADPRIAGIDTPYSVPPVAQSSYISKDSHEALVIVHFNDSSVKAQKYISQVESEIRPSAVKVYATGQVPINLAFNTTLEQDLQRAEFVALPITLILLVLIFASFVAAVLPISVGILAIVGGVGGTLFLARFTDVSQYAINVVTLIGLGVAIDYSLFIVNRFRDELAAGASREDAIAKSLSTAGRAITFSGVTVAVGLSAMLFFQGTFLASMGAAGAIVVAVAVAYGLTFLPALLSVLGPRVDRLRVPFLGSRKPAGTGAWHSMAVWVMRRPWFVLVPALAILLVAGTPFLQLRLANGDVDQLPPSNEARQGYDILVSDFPGQDQTTIDAVVYYPDGSPLTADHIGAIYDLTRRLDGLPYVLRVNSIVNVNSELTREQYQSLYSGPATQLPSALQQALTLGAGKHIVLIEVVTNKQYTSDEARSIVTAVRAESVPDGQVQATGSTAFDLDIVNYILERTPIAVGSVLLVTYVVLFLLTGSVILPLKAVLTNLFSIAASFGAMVWIFQEGHFSQLLGFSPQSIDPSIPVILFSIVFGMSMDYEVLLISRIQEEYHRTGDNQAAVAMGLEKSGRLITGAAAIMVAVFLAFALANVVIIKAIGVGLAIAIAVDATIVRILIVPSVMRILGRANWWAPKPLAILHRRIGAGEVRPTPGAVTAN